MYVDTLAPIDGQQKAYLLNRVRSIRADKESMLLTRYNIVDDPAPVSAEELVERITQGKYIITPKDPRRYDYSPFDRITWRDPAKVKDEAGHLKALEVLQAMKTKVKDAIWIGTPEDGLKAVQEFEAADVTVH
jgi:hypothetical protein